ncbi:hypothetical protein [Lacrimispora xylanisolvens]|uniref:hypothetical protein n=1 Tax=Lacrimispora xylanisolvens TaxID=384636 RepID=UPI00240274AA
MHDNFYQMYLDEMGEITPCTGEEQLKLISDLRKGNQEAKKETGRRKFKNRSGVCQGV